MKARMILMGLIGLGWMASSAKAAPLVQFASNDYFVSTGGLYVPGGSQVLIPLPGWEVANPPVFTMAVPYSESVLRNPATTFEYSGPDYPAGTYPTGYNDTLPSAKFYGGAKTTGEYGLSNTMGGAPGYRISNASGAITVDRLYANTFGGASQPSAEVTLSFLTIWRQEDFLTPSPGGASFEDGGSISFNLLAGASGRTTTARFVIGQDGDYYISSILGTATGSSAASISITDFSTLTWYDYDPVTDISVIGSEVVLDNLDGISAVGIYGLGTTTNNRASVEIYNVNIATIPEPGTMVLAGLGGVLFGMRFRRRTMA